MAKKKKQRAGGQQRAAGPAAATTPGAAGSTSVADQGGGHRDFEIGRELPNIQGPFLGSSYNKNCFELGSIGVPLFIETCIQVPENSLGSRAS